MPKQKQFLTELEVIKNKDVAVLLKKSYRGIWETAIKKYSDSAHFIYELLQNADDTKATWVEFDLEKEGLWFKHNGSVRFTISNPSNEDTDSENGTLGHINAITSIGNSTKIDEQKIGKFGIGFKAVFAYSATPHIYDDNFNFKLENYIVPTALETNSHKRKAGETLFFFPFNHKTKSVEEAYSEIEEKLQSLVQPILFLSNLKKIIWTSITNNGEYSKKVLLIENFNNIEATLVELKNTKSGVSQKDKIWLFSEFIDTEAIIPSHKISVGYFINSKNELLTGNKFEAFCFFTTKESTNLGFLIQAPFLLTDSREGIKTGEDWNITLVNKLANLSAESIICLKKIGLNNNNIVEKKTSSNLLNDNILDLIPYNENDYHNVNNKTKISFLPFYDAIRTKLKSEEIIPGINGKYFKTKNAYWAADTELTELFSDEQLSILMDNPNSGWVFTSKGQKQLNQANRSLEKYISSIVNENVDAKKLIRRFTATFIENQSDEWLIKLYSYLGSRKFLWDDADKVAASRPLLLNQDRKAIIPFDKNSTTPNIFLPSDRNTSYDTIYRPFINYPEAVEFFKALGIGMPDLKAEIFKTIIPLYSTDAICENPDLMLQHIEIFFSHYETCSATDQIELISKLKEKISIATFSLSDSETIFLNSPENTYFNNVDLKQFFNKSNGIYFFDDNFYIDILESNKKEEFIKFLTVLGVNNYPKVKSKFVICDSDKKEHFGIDKYSISITYSKNQSIYDRTMDDLDNIVKNITIEKSILLWNYLLKNVNNLSLQKCNKLFLGNFVYIPKSYSSYSTVEFESTLSKILKNDKWLYDNGNIIISATDISFQSLNSAYNVEDENTNVLLEFLGISDPNLNLSTEQFQAFNLGKKLLEEGITSEDIAQLINDLKFRKNKPVIANTEATSFDNLFNEEDIDKVLSDLKKKMISKKVILDNPDEIQNEIQIETKFEDEGDHDDFSKVAVDYQKKLDQIKERNEAEIEDILRIEKLNEIVNNSEKFSYGWFKALLELEYFESAKSNTEGKQISLVFTKILLEPGTERTLILKHPNRYIPQNIEDIGDLQIKLYIGDETKSLTVEVVSVKEYDLRAKIKKSVDLEGIDLSKVSKITIDLKNPVFLLEELRRAFFHLKLEDDYNLQTNLTDKIRFIFGPPGTGKTTYLAANEIIPLMQKKGDLKILVLTPTNKAADVLTSRIIEKMGDDESYHQWLLRFGSTASPEFENSPLVIDKTFDITSKPRNTTITTIARFPYDYFQPNPMEERLHLKYMNWDYIIIDEASMINLPNIIYILYQKTNTKFIIAGDPFQIQPITRIEQWKDMNIYTMVNLDRFVNPVTVPHAYEIINLGKQYRSLPSIGNVFSHFTYNGILEHHRTLDEQKQLNIKGLNFKDINIIKFPVMKFESIYKPNKLNGSNYQIYSALFTVEFIQNLSKQIDNSKKEKFRIGIICPYKAQATLIEKVLSQGDYNPTHTDITIGTIHGFQGDECDIIIALFNPPNNITRSQDMFLNKQNILNVAISRARDYLFILMPNDHTQKIENLYKINRIENLAHQHSINRISVYESTFIEKIMFGSETYIYDNSFATTHQSVNVYSKPDKKYEIRCEDIALDIQIKN
jgi:hypothetical protein